MPRNFTADMNEALNTASGEETPLVLVEIDHPDLAIPIRVVSDRTNIISNGDEYFGVAFRVALPDDPETGLTQASIEIDNVGRELVQWIDNADLTKPATATLRLIRPSQPNLIEFETTMFLQDIQITVSVVRGTLTYEDALDTRAVAVVYSRQTSPGIF